MNDFTSIQNFFSKHDSDGLSLLTPEEEKKLARKAKKGDVEARNKLVTSNLRFVFQSAGHYTARGHVDYEDLVASGIEGLIYAANKYDPEMGNRFTTYAKCWIDHGIRKYLNEMVPHLRVPVGQIQKIRRLHRELVKRNQELQDNSIEEESIAREEGEDPLRVQAVKNAFSVMSYDEAGKEFLLNDYSPKGGDNSDDEAYAEMEAQLSALKQLPSMHEDVIKRYYGIGCESQTLQHISKIYLLSRERIRQIKDEALNSLRDILSDSDN